MADGKVAVRHRGCDGVIAKFDGGVLRSGHTPTFKRMGDITASDAAGLTSATLPCRRCEAMFALPLVWAAANDGAAAGKATVRLSAPMGQSMVKGRITGIAPGATDTKRRT